MRIIKTCLFITALLLTLSTGFAQPDTLWSARISTTGNPAIYKAIEHSSGDFFLVGATNPGLASSNFLITRLSPAGAILWTRTYGGPAEDAAQSCIETPDGNLLVTGWGNGGNSLLLMAVSAAGDSLWSRIYSSGARSFAYDLTLLQDGNIAVVGGKMGTDSLHTDLWLLKCTLLGDTVWTESFGGADNDIGYRIHERQDQSLMMAGYSRSGPTNYDLWLLHTDSLGSQLSSSVFGGSEPDFCYDLSDGDTAVYLSGKASIGGSNVGYLAKVRGTGDSLWVRRYTHGGVEEQIRGIVARNSGGAVGAGWTGPSWNERQCWLMAVNSEGTELWQWTLDPFASGFYGILSVSSGGYLAYGQQTVINSTKGYAMRFSLSEINGTVEESETGIPVVGVNVGIVGRAQSVITDHNGNYQLGIVGGVYDVAVWGNCISRQTQEGILVPQDSAVTVNFQVLRPHYLQSQSSINAVVYNHVLTPFPLQIANTGNGRLEFGISTETISPVGNWLSVSPDTGFVRPGDSLTVQVEIHTDTTDDALYDFHGNLHVITNSCPGEAVTVPIEVSVLGAKENVSVIPASFSLSAYPNPFNPMATITFSVPQAVKARLVVFDINGRQTALLTDGRISPGIHNVQFDAGLLPSGLYFVQFESTDYKTTRKIMLIK